MPASKKKTKSVEGEVLALEARTPDDLSSVPMQIMDQADESTMANFFKGMPVDALDKWVYEFNQGGKLIRGLSWVGTKEVTTWLTMLPADKGKMIVSEEPQFTKLEEITIDGTNYCDATVVYKDLVTGRQVSGNARQSYLRKNGSKADVEFIPRMALSKAQRNAVQKLIPEQTILTFIDYAKKQGKVQTIAQSKEQIALSPGELQSAAPYLSKVEELNSVEELREYFREVGKMTDIPAKVILSISTAIQIKAEKLKDAAAKVVAKTAIQKIKEKQEALEKEKAVKAKEESSS